MLRRPWSLPGGGRVQGVGPASGGVRGVFLPSPIELVSVSLPLLPCSLCAPCSERRRSLFVQDLLTCKCSCKFTHLDCKSRQLELNERTCRFVPMQQLRRSASPQPLPDPPCISSVFAHGPVAACLCLHSCDAAVSITITICMMLPAQEGAVAPGGSRGWYQTLPGS